MCKYIRDLFTGYMAIGVEVTRVWNKLELGTGESCFVMVKMNNTNLHICEYESKDVLDRCGRSRSSDEVDVMSMERRISFFKGTIVSLKCVA